MSPRRVRVFPDAAALAAGAAEELARAAAASAGPFRVALSGGATPKTFYSLLPNVKPCFPWDRIHFFWSDERCVPASDPGSNYRMAFESFLNRVPVPPANVHRVKTELPDAAELYAREVPARFDWIFLGLGEDGHAASLFPGTAAVSETNKLVVSVPAEGKRVARVSFTLPLLNAARRVAFVVSGAAKAEIVRAVLEEKPSPDRPASLVSPVDGELLWLLDAPAAARLAR